MSVSSASSRGPQLQWAPDLRTPSTEQDRTNISDEDEDEEDYHEDWSRTTEDKDSYAAKERQRNIGNIKWKKIENYPKPAPPGQEQPRAGSILSVFEIGHQDGQKIPEDPEERREYERKRRLSSSGVTQLEKIEDYPQLKKEYDEGRLGSVLGVFVKEHQHFDDVIVVSEDKSQERRGSDAFEPSIEKIENYPRLSKEHKRPDGRHGSIFSALNDERELLPTDASSEDVQSKGERRPSSKVEKRPVIENYPENSHKRTTSGNLEAPAVSPRDARRGSVLSLWTTGSDDHQFDDVVEDKDSDKQSSRSSIGSKSLEAGSSRKARALSGSGQERHGSILSMWAPGKDKDGTDVMDHGDEDDTMEDQK